MQATLPRHLAAYYGALPTFDRHGAAGEGAVRLVHTLPGVGARVTPRSESATSTCG